MKRDSLTISLMTALVCLTTIFATTSNADVQLPGYYSDHMVFQRDMPLRIFGWAEPGERVTVTLAGESGTATCNDEGRWQVTLPALAATATPQTLVVRGENTIELKDILIGEVWLCSGQSNMEWRVRQSANADAEIAAATDSLIRHVKVPRQPSPLPRTDITAAWQVCSPDTVAEFTACGYYMARMLREELDVPIGLVNSSWGGTRVEPWTPPNGFEQVDALQDIYESVMNRRPGSAQYEQRLRGHIEATEAWLAQAQDSLENATIIDASPAFPAELLPFASHQDPTMLFNGMIHALVGFPIRGAIWYQGESNHSEGMLYTEKKKALINGWRELWDQGDFPFYFVQIAPFQYGEEDPTILAEFWEAQEAVLQVENTGMVVINDIATLNDIHPPNKQDVGKRLAQLALRNDYGYDDLVASSPTLASMEFVDETIRLTFDSTGGELKTRDGLPPTHFELIGDGSAGFQPANASIDGNTIILSAENVEAPTAFRFAWHKLAEPNLTGATGLPVGACRAGDVPEFINTIPESDQYQLVYDLDLSRLGGDINYDVDNSQSIGSFDRVGYLLELNAGNEQDQRVFVSMDAFTEDVSKIGVPTADSNAVFQVAVSDLDVFTNFRGITTGTGLSTGNIEFWPHNYGTQNAARIQGASNNVYDFGDQPSEPVAGYGCMQVHNFGAGETIFAINHWGQGGQADIGIGNSEGRTRDWTFTGNASTYVSKRLRIYVRPE